MPFNFVGKFDEAMEAKVLDQIESKYGKLLEFVDDIILVLPPGADDFIAWAYFFGMVSAYKMITLLSIQPMSFTNCFTI